MGFCKQLINNYSIIVVYYVDQFVMVIYSYIPRNLSNNITINMSRYLVVFNFYLISIIYINQALLQIVFRV